MRFRALRYTRSMVHGTRGAYIIPSLSKMQQTRARFDRDSQRSGRIEKRAAKARSRGSLSFLPTYLPVLRLSNWLGTYVAKPQKYISRARIAAVCVEPMIIPASSGPCGARYIVIIMKQG